MEVVPKAEKRRTGGRGKEKDTQRGSRARTRGGPGEAKRAQGEAQGAPAEAEGGWSLRCARNARTPSEDIHWISRPLGGSTGSN